MDKTTVERVIEEAGGVSALASKLGVKPPTVYQWKSGDRKVSPRLAIAMSKKFPGIASVHDLRPDVFGPEPERSAA
ncbi:helix-turn-helix domain-containing protein [Lysobacter sp. GX 14042]|uniref:transcriptional regulator n=1 Tax=Lysobacter sp. GX 14042 TaxID=2907155 RepID=UPI001F206BAB|nr:YdaS family helix-turn-helix protein [Lysobacter sp. GX 14042]MCE7031763.1 helix-turn-helix domain-containing protein [Lysobacter sp. GX 14042]